MTSPHAAQAFETWWHTFPERFSHQKNHAKVGWLAAWLLARQETVEEIAMPMLKLVERTTKDFRDPYDAFWRTHGGLVDDHLTDQWQSCELCRLVITLRATLGGTEGTP